LYPGGTRAAAKSPAVSLALACFMHVAISRKRQVQSHVGAWLAQAGGPSNAAPLMSPAAPRRYRSAPQSPRRATRPAVWPLGCRHRRRSRPGAGSLGRRRRLQPGRSGGVSAPSGACMCTQRFRDRIIAGGLRTILSGLVTSVGGRQHVLNRLQLPWVFRIQHMHRVGTSFGRFGKRAKADWQSRRRGSAQQQSMRHELSVLKV
jgi:hypothetical protein